MSCFKYFLILFFFSILKTAGAQNFSLSGSINDADDHTFLEGATIKLFALPDTIHWTGAITDTTGKFIFLNLPNGFYKLQVSYLGYNTLNRFSKINGADKNVGLLLLAKNDNTLKNVNIVAQEKRVEQKTDTIEYNAKAYKTHPDANAEDLVTKMPGITSENGTVKAHGENVQKVLIDGKEFFGNDATLALKNLPAEVVDRVQVFDRMSDQAWFTGFDDGNSEKAMNISTRPGKNNGVFGKIYAGYGYLTDSRYSAGAMLNWFKQDRRISLIYMSNNVNQQNFSMQDLLGVTGGNAPRFPGGGPPPGGRPPGGGGGFGGNAVNNFLVGNNSGNTTTHSVGFNYIDTWGKKIKVTGSYFFNYTDNLVNSTTNRKYYSTTDTSTYYSSNNSNESVNMNHRINLRLEYFIDTMNKITFTPKINIQQNNQTYITNGQNSLNNTALLSSTLSNYKSYNFGYNASGDLLFQHKFKKPSRTFSFTISGSANNKNGNTSLSSANKYLLLNDSIVLEQQANNFTNSYSISGNVAYTEPAGKTGMIQIAYNPSYNWNFTGKQTYNYDTAAHTYSVRDSSLSNKLNNTYLVQRGGLSYRLKYKNLNLMAGVNAQYALLNGEQTFPLVFTTQKSFVNVLPTFQLNYKFSETSNIRVVYRTSTNPPSVSQLQNVIDNSNPLLLSTGNQNLKQNYSHFGMVRFGFTNPKKAQSFFAFASVNYTQNYIGNSTFIAQHDTMLNGTTLLRAGSQLTQPINLKDGSMNANTFFTYGLPISKIKCNLNLNAGLSYTRTPSVINNAENLSNSYNVNAGFVLGSNINEKIDFTISYSANYNVVKNSLQKKSDNNYFTHNANIKFNWLFWKGFVFNTSLQNTFYAGVSQGFNQDIFLWNISLGYKFLKDKSLEVKAGVSDVLNQNSSIGRTVSDTYVEDSKTQVLKRYLMMTVTYTLRYFKK